MARKLSEWEREERQRQKEKAARTFYGVFLWEEANQYRLKDVIILYKSESTAQRKADRMNADEQLGAAGYVVRSIEINRD